MATEVPRALIDLWTAKVDEANAAAVNYRQATSGKDEAVATLLNTSDDDQIVAFREWRAKVQAQIDAALATIEAKTAEVREYAESNLDASDVDPEALKKTYLDARAEATKMRAGLVGFFGEEAVAKIVEAEGIEEITNLRGTNRKGATGIKRPRLESATVNGEAVEKDGKVSFTLLGQHVSKHFGKVSGNDLKDAAFAAAGTNDLSTVNEPVNYSFTLSDGKVVQISVTPKVAGEDDSNEDDEDEAPESATSAE
jgi:hypothetical protein